MPRDRIIEQLRRNAVAIISLVIAITSLTYNTWRNEHSEDNRNQRWASFEILLKLGELQELVFLNHYDCNTVLRGNTRTGWVIVQTVQDLALVLEDMSGATAERLRDAWAANWAGLEYDGDEACRKRTPERRTRGEASKDAVIEAIGAVRADILDVLYSLD